MKKGIAWLLTAAILFLSSCSLVDKVNQVLEEANTIERHGSPNTLGEFEIGATEYALGVDENGNNIIWVNYRFVNNGDDASSFFSGIDCHLYQNGVRLESSYLYTPVNDEVYIKSGAAVNVEYVYELIDTISDVEIVFELGGSTVYFGEGADDKLTQIIEISEYSG